MEKKFSHLDDSGNPAMVDVSQKAITHRKAIAQAIILLPEVVIEALEKEDWKTKKGSVFQTAILAGIMGTKKTGELIPLCHPLALEKVGVDIYLNAQKEVVIHCTASLSGKTGVEMEALTGASIAALTVYDMCKAFSHDIIIKEIKLIEKTGGKSDFKYGA
jgi:cyclic pyranopterin monophosphate synthase